MRVGMELPASFLVVVATLMFVASASSAYFDAHPLARDNFPYPGVNPRVLALRGYQRPEFDFAYTEVLTPYYHYYFFAPAFKTFPKHFNPEYTRQDSYTPPYNSWTTLENNLFTPQGSVTSGNEYYSPQLNDVGFPTREIPVQSPKFRNDFLGKPYFTPVKPDKLPHPSPNPTLDFTTSFLPTALSSGTPNIIRKEDEGRAIHDRISGPRVYAPSFKDHAPHNVFESNPSAYKPLLNSSMFSSAAPNIIRDEVPSISKLFKPVLTSSSNQFLSRNPSSLPPPYFSTSPTSIGRTDPYHSLTPVSPSLSPPFISSTRSPLSFQEGGLPDYSDEETLTPIFTSSPTPVEGFTSPAPLHLPSPSVHPGPNTAPPESPRVLFEAPGHAQPRRR